MHYFQAVVRSRSKVVLNVTDTFKPIVFIFSVTGIMFKRTKPITAFFLAAFVHHLVILVMVWAMFLKFCAVYEPPEDFGILLVGKILMHAISLQCATSTSVMTHVSNHIWTFLDDWQTYRDKYNSPEWILKKVKRNIRFGVGFVTIGVCFGLIDISIGFIVSENIFSYVMYLPLSKTMSIHELPVAVYVLGMVYIIYAYGSLCQSQCLFGLLCLGLKYEFQHFTHSFKKNVASKGIAQDGLETFRQQHREMCLLVSKFDNIFSAYVFLVFITCVPMICFLIYSLIFIGSTDWRNIMPLVQGIITLVTVLMLVVMFGATLTNAVCITLLHS